MSIRTMCRAASPPSSTLPDAVRDRQYYTPTRYGAEARYADVVERVRERLGRAGEGGEQE